MSQGVPLGLRLASRVVSPSVWTPCCQFVEAYELPYGNVITVGVKRLRYAEVLLQPETDESSDNEIIIVGVEKLRCAEVLFLAETHELVDNDTIIVDAKRFPHADGLFPSRFDFNVVPS